jgi:hypothetical protein
MADEFTVKILKPEEFNKLPFKRIQDNPDAVLGAADVASKTAYVKDTGFNDLTKANIGHELDELMAATSPHEEDGIRYKDFSQSFGSFLGNAPAIGGLLKPLGSLVGGGIDLLGAGAGKLGLPNFNIGSPSASQISAASVPGVGTAGNLFSAPPIGGTDQGGAAVADILDRNAVGGSIPKFGGGIDFNAPSTLSLPGFGTGSGSTSPSFLSSPSSSQFAAPPLPGASLTSRAEPLSFGEKFLGGATNVLKDLFKGGGEDGEGLSPGRTALGIGTALAGNLFAPKVDAPDFSGVREDLRGRLGEGGSPAFDLGFGEAKRILGETPGQVPQALFDEIDLRRDEQIRALEDRFRSAQGGGGLSESDTSQFGRLRAQIVDQFEREKAALEFDFRNQQQAERIETMKTVLQLDESQFNQYARIAELEVSEIMANTGIDVAEATAFKELFGNLGTAILSPGGQSSLNFNFA